MTELATLRLAIESGDIKAAVRELEKLESAAKKTEVAAKKNEESFKGFGSTLGIVRSAGALFLAQFSAQALLGVAKNIIRISDAATNLRTQLALSTRSANQASEAWDKLFDIANRSRVSFVELGTTFAQISRATEDIGLSQADLLRVTETLGKAITISGASASSANAAMIQLSQGLAAGVLRGEEFNSVMENTNRVARAIAEGMGIPLGALRKYAQEGKLTAEIVTEALLKSSSTIDAEFSKSSVTVSQSMAKLGNSLVAFVDQANKASGASRALSTAIDEIAKSIDRVSAAQKINEKLRTPWFMQALPSQMQALLVLLGLLDKKMDDIAGRTSTVEMLDDFGMELIATGKAADKAAAGLRAFISDSDNLSKAEKKLEAQNKLLSEFARTVKGFANDSPQYKQALDALNQGLQNIDDKFKDKGAEKYADAFDKLKESMDDQIKSLDLQIDKNRELKESEKFLITSTRQLAEFEKEYGKGKSDIISKLNMEIFTRLKLIEAKEDEKKLAEAEEIVRENLRAAREESLRAALDERDSLWEKVKASEDELLAMTATKEKLRELELSRYDEMIAGKEAIRATLEGLPERGAEIAAINDQIDAIRRLKDARQAIFERQDFDASIAYEIGLTKNTVGSLGDDLERALTDSLFRAAESGKDAFESMRDSIRGMFNNLVLKPIIKMGVQGALGLVGSGLSSQGGALGNLGTALNLASGASSFANNPLMNALGGLGTGAYSAFATSGIGASLGLSTSLSSVVGSQAAMALGGETAILSSSGSSVLGAFSSAMPYIALAAALWSVFGGDDSGTPHMGGLARANKTGAGAVRDSDLFNLSDAGLFDSKAEQSMVSLSKGIQQSFSRALSALGQSSDVEVYTGFADDSSKDGAWGQFKVAIGDFAAIDWSALDTDKWPGLGFADGEKGYQEFTEMIASDLVTALKTQVGPGEDGAPSSLGKFGELAQGVVDDIPAGASLEQVIAALDTISAMRVQFDALSQTFELLGINIEWLFTSVFDTNGGIAGLSQIAGDFYNITRTDAEKFHDLSTATAAAFAELGQEMPDSIASYRQLVEDLQDTNKIGLAAGESEEDRQNLIIDLMTMAPVMGTLDQMAQSLNETLDSTSVSLALTSADFAAFYETVGESEKSVEYLGKSLREALSEIDPDAIFPTDLAGYISMVESASGDAQGSLASLAGDMVRYFKVMRTEAANSLGSWSRSFSAMRALYSEEDQLSMITGKLRTEFEKLGITFLDTADEWISAIESAEGDTRDTLMNELLPLWYDANNIRASIEAEATRRAEAQMRRMEDQRREWERLAEAMDKAKDSIRAFLDDLFVGPQSILSPEQQLSAAKSLFDSLVDKAREGSIEATQALPEAAKRYVDVARDMYASSATFTAIFKEVADQLGVLTGYEVPDTTFKFGTTAEGGITMASDNMNFDAGSNAEAFDKALAFNEESAHIAYEQYDVLTSMDAHLASIESWTQLMAVSNPDVIENIMKHALPTEGRWPKRAIEKLVNDGITAATLGALQPSRFGSNDFIAGVQSSIDRQQSESMGDPFFESERRRNRDQNEQIQVLREIDKRLSRIEINGDLARAQ